ncbi:hypothetical protein CYMTET_5693 [Cymbomonas tetramitiformis]|uniref:Uncharacterized protein n=1 Tax=Cymbomonas tetramitiformis TaxID=36881 RepID=A0AAE0GYZ7_9CHLO|nr:hypothetical protein CYMTET_5693 [Cymbomonas tetramitiformis]
MTFTSSGLSYGPFATSKCRAAAALNPKRVRAPWSRNPQPQASKGALEPQPSTPGRPAAVEEAGETTTERTYVVAITTQETAHGGDVAMRGFDVALVSEPADDGGHQWLGAYTGVELAFVWPSGSCQRTSDGVRACAGGQRGAESGAAPGLGQRGAESGAAPGLRQRGAESGAAPGLDQRGAESGAAPGLGQKPPSNEE